MAITLAVRGDSLDARYATGRKSPAFFTETGATLPPVVVNAALPGMIGSHYIDMYRGGAVNRCGLIYDGFNMWDARPWSVLFRAARKRNANMGMFGTSSGTGEPQGANSFFRSTDGNVYIQQLRTDAALEMRDQQSFGAGMTLDVFHDVVFTSTGATGANGLKCYIDGVLVAQYANLVNAEATKSKALGQINVGFCLNLVVGGYYLEEFVMWKVVIDPIAGVLLANGTTAALTGPTRTSMVAADVFEGATSIDPGVANVLSGTAYQIAGVAKTGTYAILSSVDPGVANVLEGTGYTINSVAKVGTYEILESTDPGEANVLEGVEYIINDVDKVGSLLFEQTVSEVTANLSSAEDLPVIPIIQGEDRSVRIVLKRGALPYSLIGATEIEAKLLKTDGTALSKKLSLAGVSIIDAANGTFDVILTETDTADLKVAGLLSMEVIYDVGSVRRIFQLKNVIDVVAKLY